MFMKRFFKLFSFLLLLAGALFLVNMRTNNEAPQQTWKRLVDQANRLAGIKPVPSPIQAPIPIIAPTPKPAPVGGGSWRAVGDAVFKNLESKAYLELVVCSSDDSKTNAPFDSV
jgi:hypothetical protein